MRLSTKLTLFNTISKALIIAVFILLVPVLADRVALSHTDNRLLEIRTKVLSAIGKVGLTKFIEEEQDSVFSSYNILKEQFISIEPSPVGLKEESIENTQRSIDEEVIDYRVLSHAFREKNKLYLLEIGKSLSDIEDLNNILKRIALYVLILVLSITVVIDFGFTQFLLKPFKRIINYKLSETHHPQTFNYSVTPTTTSDFKLLDQSINEMMRKINNAFLIEKEFIANVSHELLTPISILETRFENMIADASTTSDTAVKLVESQKTLNRLKKITRTLLLISQIENNQYLKEDEINLNELLTEVLSEIEERATEKNIQIECDFKLDNKIKELNKTLLFTMFFNIINNAIKYNVVNGRVLIRTYRQNNLSIVEISDSGIGIDQLDQNKIFNRFSKLNKTEIESFGLGLPIVKTIADFHHINIELESSKENGSLFRFRFNKI